LARRGACPPCNSDKNPLDAQDHLIISVTTKAREMDATPPPRRRYLLCPSTEGCHVIARSWSRPLGDFALDEFCSLIQLFEGPSAPLGDAAAVARARVRLREGVGPVPIHAQLSREVATRIASRLTAATLHEVLCEAADMAGLRDEILRCDEAKLMPPSPPTPLTTPPQPLQPAMAAMAAMATTTTTAEVRATTATTTTAATAATRPHVLLMQFPGADGSPLSRMGGKRRKALLKDCLEGTPLDPEGDGGDGGPMGCGQREARGPSGVARRGVPPSHSSSSVSAAARPHLAVLWDAAAESTVDRCYLVRPLGVEAALARVHSLPQPAFDTRHLGKGKVTPVRPELAWILTNLAAVRPGALVLDPFVGTGSVLLPSLALGAPFALGLDIADPHLQPQEENAEVAAAAVVVVDAEVGGGGTKGENACGVDTDGTAAGAAAAPVLRHDHARANARRLPFRARACTYGGVFDAIICDPPYGLRKPRMLDQGVKDDTVEDMDQMQDAVTATMVRIRDLCLKNTTTTTKPTPCVCLIFTLFVCCVFTTNTFCYYL
jgi:predicted RNA methylase